MAKEALTAGDVDDLVAQVDTGARNPEDWQGKVIVSVAFIWAIFQLYIASNLPFYLTESDRFQRHRHQFQCAAYPSGLRAVPGVPCLPAVQDKPAPVHPLV